MKAVFQAQAWIDDYAINIDPLGEVEFGIGTREEAIAWWRGEDMDIRASEGAIFSPDQYESDNFRFHPAAPKWIQEWAGPFYITFEED